MVDLHLTARRTLKGELIGRTYTWQRVKVYTVRYRSKHGEEIVVKTLRPPLKSRIFRVASKPGRRRFHAVAGKTHTQEVLVVAAKAKKGKKAAVLDEEELEQLEELEDVDDDDDEEEAEVDETEADDEDEDSDDDESDDDEEDEEEEKPKKKAKKGKTTSKSTTKKKKSKSKKTDDKIGTAEVAEAAGITPRQLRMALRKWKKEGKEWAEPSEETGRYEWDSLEDAEEVIDNAKEKAAEATKEQTDKLKKDKKSKSGKKGKKSKSKKKKAVEEDEDEDE